MAPCLNEWTTFSHKKKNGFISNASHEKSQRLKFHATFLCRKRYQCNSTDKIARRIYDAENLIRHALWMIFLWIITHRFSRERTRRCTSDSEERKHNHVDIM
ncbi:unnamed protein product [Albugo candida]|uniref:Uncharacterized protein n=1 Tax=Albugo candida TaxID=65357 RepID=A0A024FWE0_9STRA|nr:unnamed protein product [Albugo candida]|eukprot:CCI10964.1 unnamed protein product [Albugo candida]